MFPLAATDTVSLALERTKRMLFRPVRFGVWWRLAILAFFTGEISSGSNFSFRHGDISSIPAEIKKYYGWIILGACVGFVLYLVLTYVRSVLHFVLYEAVLTGTIRIQDSWRRWRDRGRSYFGFNLLMFVASVVIAGAIAGPAYLAYRAGIFSTAHLGLAILIGLVLGSVAISLFLSLALFALMTKDFVLPIMMFEGVGVFDGWRRAWPMVKAEGKRYAGFYGLKLVLRIAAGVLFTMVLFIFIFMMIIPVAIVIAIAVPGMKGGVHGAPLLIALLAVVILIGFAVLLLLVACFGTPIAVFFTSYTLQFFGSRYEPLRVILYPEPPLMPPPLVPVVPVTPLPPPVSA